VDVSQAGAYTLVARVASGGAGGTLHLEADAADLSGAVVVPGTGGWQSWQDVEATVELAAGVQVLRLCADTDGFNLDYLELSAAGTDPADPPVDDPWIELVSPNGGEVLYAGTVVVIEFEANVIDNVEILYSTEPGLYAMVEPSLLGSQPGWERYEWTVPDTPSTACTVVVASYSGYGISDESDGTFEIRTVSDGDGDGMDDDWENATFGDLTHDATTDADEFLAGTDPLIADAEAFMGSPALSCANRASKRRGTSIVSVWLLALALLVESGCRARRARR